MPPMAPKGARAVREISDPRTMRAFAHPVRIALIEALRREGSLTATRAAEILDETRATCPGTCRLWRSTALSRRRRAGGAGAGPGGWGADLQFRNSPRGPRKCRRRRSARGQRARAQLPRLREWWSYVAPIRTGGAGPLSPATPSSISPPRRPTRSTRRSRRSPVTGRGGGKEEGPGALPVHFVAFAHPFPPHPRATERPAPARPDLARRVPGPPGRPAYKLPAETM